MCRRANSLYLFLSNYKHCSQVGLLVFYNNTPLILRGDFSKKIYLFREGEREHELGESQRGRERERKSL